MIHLPECHEAHAMYALDLDIHKERRARGLPSDTPTKPTCNCHAAMEPPMETTPDEVKQFHERHPGRNDWPRCEDCGCEMQERNPDEPLVCPVCALRNRVQADAALLAEALAACEEAFGALVGAHAADDSVQGRARQRLRAVLAKANG